MDTIIQVIRENISKVMRVQGCRFRRFLDRINAGTRRCLDAQGPPMAK